MFVNNCVLIVLLIVIIIQSIDANKAEEVAIKKLRTELFQTRDYNVMTVPVKNWSHTIDVTLDYNLIKIIDLDINSHIMTTEGWLQYIWTDQHLTWKPEEYDGIGVIRVSPDEVFKPDLMLYNSADMLTMKDNSIKINLLLYSNGLINWIPPVVLKSLCDMDLTNWPYDEQNCSLKFGSWTYDGLAINISHTKGVITHDYWKSQEWDIIETSAIREDKYYECCEEPYPSITFYIRVRRKTSLYHYTIYLPVTTAVILNLLMFWYSIRSVIRFILSSISLLMLTFMLLYLGSKFGFGTDTIPYAIRSISRIIFTIGLTFIWITIAYNLVYMRIQLPDSFRRLIAPAERLCQRSGIENDRINLTNEDQMDSDVKTDKSFETLISIIDKLVFGIFLVIIMSLHL